MNKIKETTINQKVLKAIILLLNLQEGYLKKVLRI